MARKKVKQKIKTASQVSTQLKKTRTTTPVHSSFCKISSRSSMVLKKCSLQTVGCTSIFRTRGYSNSWIFRIFSVVPWISLINYPGFFEPFFGYLRQYSRFSELFMKVARKCEDKC